MTNQKNDMTLDPQEMVETIERVEAGLKIGMVGNYPDTDETRMLLTPEACGMLTSSGIKVCMEAGAGVDISFSDATYAEYGVEIVTRDEALRSPLVLSYAPLRAKDIKKMNKGAGLICMMGSILFEQATIKALLSQHITLGCLDNMVSHNEMEVFANIIDEIDGRGAIMYAQESLSYLGGGKGVLLASVAGLNPCEVLLIGVGTEMVAAAKSAVAQGARVTLMDNDISALQEVKRECGHLVDAIAIHPRVLYNKVKSADVIITGLTTRNFDFPKNLSAAMKENVYVLDLTETHPSISVPRTVAMAMSNAMVNFLIEMQMKDSFQGMIVTTPGVQCGIVTYNGKLVDKLIGSYLSMPCVDISVMLSGGAN
ncbi:MAG: hypothetical protein K2L89_08280 [Muribaculaceae bacterium]|nr:hypothetical protein [Muribaculaceae bacterium]